MKRILILAIVVAFLTSTSAAPGRDWAPFQFSVNAKYQMIGADKNIYGVRLGIFHAANLRVHGADMCLFVNTIDYEFAGLQVAGALNDVSSRIDGVQVAGGANLVGMKDGGKVNGIQLAGLGNDAGNVTGCQMSTILNNAGIVDGLQLGAINRSETHSGIQLGLVNISGEMHGIQLGLVNKVRWMSGAQIGLVNICTQSDVPFLPIIYVHF